MGIMTGHKADEAILQLFNSLSHSAAKTSARDAVIAEHNMVVARIGDLKSILAALLEPLDRGWVPQDSVIEAARKSLGEWNK